MGEYELYGLDLILRLAEKDIKEKIHVLTSLVHWKLTKERFKCLGLGDDPTLGPSETGSEYLPEGWSTGADRIRYVYEGQVYVLIILKSEGLVIYNFLHPASGKTTVVHFNIEDTVANLKGSIEELVPAYKDVVDNITHTMIMPHVVMRHQETSTQTTSTSTDTSRDLRDDRGGFSHGRYPGISPITPYGVGHSDLYPFGIGGSSGGGMLFDPINRQGRGFPDPGIGIPGGLPRGSVPPGARFDPVGPPMGIPHARRQPPPDADHLPPPGYDDMFM